MTHGNACTCKVAVRHLLFVSRDKQGSSWSGGRRGWGSLLCPQQHHMAWGRGYIEWNAGSKKSPSKLRVRETWTHQQHLVEFPGSFLLLLSTGVMTLAFSGLGRVRPWVSI